ncbi:MAG: Re/Si-specific NAD(P)(+) transhydrogenase subunit alpha [Hyphomicrobiales bacterium]|nr:Re/Si-specific NAD(P)(+) transhydrogenase subunit alpha [Hyphomicrobiales bacterium]
MLIGVPAETEPAETRVAASPETVKKFVGLGAEAAIERGAGLEAGMVDADYEAAGARMVSTAEALGADLVLKVRRPSEREIAQLKSGALVVAIMDPHGHRGAIEAMAHAGVAAFAMELLPRITRAQVMDVLSSQANLAGYRAVIDAAAEYGRLLPMMMTPAGTVAAARLFVMGVGVAGLQAIATGRRLGAVVTATDVRPATKEQVESLGAKFVAVEDEEFRQAETAGGYAKEMSEAYKAKQAALLASHIAKQDIVVTTALIPGRPAPRLVSADMVKSMRAGSVILDLAVERGGNCELSKPGETIVSENGVKVVGYSSVTRLAATASSLYARNLFAFAETLIDKPNKSLAVNWDDELVKATCLTRGGAIVHPDFQSQ